MMGFSASKALRPFLARPGFLSTRTPSNFSAAFLPLALVNPELRGLRLGMNPVAISRYYFAVRDDQTTPDEEGMEAAQAGAARMLADMARNAIQGAARRHRAPDLHRRQRR